MLHNDRVMAGNNSGHISIRQMHDLIESLHHLTQIDKCTNRVAVDNILLVMTGIVCQDDPSARRLHTNKLLTRRVATNEMKLDARHQLGRSMKDVYTSGENQVHQSVDIARLHRAT